MPKAKNNLKISENSLEINKAEIVQDILANLEQVRALRNEVKRLCSVFDVEAKTRVAVFKGLPEETFYHLPYRVWMKVSRRHQANLDLMFKHYKEFGAYKGVDYYRKPKNEWYHDFGVWAKLQGFYWY